MDYALLNLAVTIALVLATFAFRKRILAALGRLLFDGAVKIARASLLTEEVSEGPDGVKVARIGLSAQGKAIVASVVPSLIEVGLQTVKLKLPKFAPINPSTGQLDFTAGIAAKMADGKKVNIEEIAKAIFMQVGMPFIEAKVGPMLQGVMQGVGQATATPEKKEKESENPFLKELNL